MNIPQKEYTLDSFTQMLVATPEALPNLKARYFLTSFRDWGDDRAYTITGMFRNHNFQLKQLGDIRELSTSYEIPETKQFVRVKYYAHLNPETQVLVCFTQATGAQMERTIDSISRFIGVYDLWISPVAFDEIKRTILLEYPYTKIPFFSADRHSSSGLSAKIRPEYKRTFQYHGDDGRETLEELRYYYGVLPRSIQFRIPGVTDFQINHRGTFNYYGGDLNRMFDHAERAVNLVLQVRRILEQSKLQVLDIETARKHLKVPYVIPWRIDFKRELSVTDAEVLVEAIQKNGFAVYNSVISQGSTFLDGTVYDEQKKSVFAMSSDSRRMVVAPRYRNSFDSFLRFYETITENFDPEAICAAAI